MLVRLVTESNKGLDAVFVLDEILGGLGVVLWQLLRDVVLWSTASEAEHSRLFRDHTAARERLLAIEVPGEIAAAVERLADLPGVASDTEMRAIQNACGLVAEWAGARDAPRTAMAYARAGALAAPFSGTAAANAGFTALQWQDLPRAEVWLRRACALTRHTDQMTFALARMTLGQLYASRDDLLRARSAFLQALRATRGRRDALEVRVQAAIALFHNANVRKAPQEAERAAGVALRAFGRRHPEITIVGRQLAEQWLRQGKNNHALRLLERLQQIRVRRAERVEILALLARAAAASADGTTVRHAWQRVAWLLRDDAATEEGVRALVTLASTVGGAVPSGQAAAVVRRAVAMAAELGRPELIPVSLAARYGAGDDDHTTWKD